MAALTALELGGESKNEFHNPRTSVELTEQKLEIAKIDKKFKN